MVKLIGLLLLFTQTALASGVISEAGIAPYRSGFTNYVKNPSGFKNVRNITTSSASITRDTDAADKLDGIASLVCDSSADGGYCEWTMNTIQEGDKTGNCEAIGVFKGDASLYKVQVTDTTNVLASSSVLSNASDWTAFSVNFPCGSSRSIRLTQTESGTGAAVNVGRVYWGKATNIGSVAQATFWGSAKHPATANCEWGQSGAGTFTADTDCTTPTVTGNASAPSTKIPGIRFSSGLPPGEYLVMAIGSFSCNNASNNCVAAISLSDGTSRTSIQKIIGSATGTTTYAESVSAVVGRFNYTTAQGDTTIQLYSEQVAAGNLFVNANTSITSSDLQFLVYRFPTSEETAYRPEINAAYYSGYHSSDCSWSRTNTAYGDFTADASCTLVTRVSSGITAAATGSVLPALALTLPKTGAYYVCGNITYAGGSVADHSVRLWDGTTVIAEATETAGNPTTIPLCGIYNATALNPTLTIQGKSTSGSVVAQPQDAGTTVKWTIFPINQNGPAPVLVGSVTSGSTGAERIERGSVTTTCSSTPCTIASQSGSSITSITRSGTGTYAINFAAGTWSSVPVCIFTSAGDTRMFLANSPSTTVWGFISFNASGSGADSNFNFICMGPR